MEQLVDSNHSGDQHGRRLPSTADRYSIERVTVNLSKICMQNKGQPNGNFSHTLQEDGSPRFKAPTMV
jgi:hypothetical protein